MNAAPRARPSPEVEPLARSTRIRAVRTAWALVLGLAVCGRVGGARAAPAVETRFFDERARAAYADGDYRGALRYFLLATGSSPSAGLLYNIAIAAELAGEPGLAWSYLERYLASADDDDGRRREARSRAKRLRRELALVRVDTDPPGVTVYVDRRELGAFASTPCTVPIAPGKRRITLELRGYAPASVVVDAERGRESTARATLEPLTGELAVRADPPEMMLTFQRDGRSVEPRRRGGSWVLPVGRYLVRGVAPGHAPVELSAAVIPGARVRVDLVAPPLPTPSGSLLVSTGSVPAQLVVDGRLRAITPARLDGLPAGDHEIELIAEGMRRWRGRVRIEKSARRYLNVTLRPNRKP